MSIMMATFSLVPTPSALETRIGSLNFFMSSAKSAPKLPIPPSTPLVKVRVARWRMRFFASSATAIFTPASAYLMEVDQGPCFLQFNDGGRATGLRYSPASENVEQTPPSHSAGMDNAVQISQEAFTDLPGL